MRSRVAAGSDEPTDAARRLIVKESRAADGCHHPVSNGCGSIGPSILTAWKD